LVSLLFGRILVREVFHWIQVTETPNWPVFFASVTSLAVSFVSKRIFLNPVEQNKIKVFRTMVVWVQPARDRLLKDCLLTFSKDSLSKDGPAQVGPIIALLDAIPDSTLSSKQVVPHPNKHNFHKCKIYVQIRSFELKLGPHRSVSVQITSKWHSGGLGPNPGTGKYALGIRGEKNQKAVSQKTVPRRLDWGFIIRYSGTLGHPEDQPAIEPRLNTWHLSDVHWDSD